MGQPSNPSSLGSAAASEPAATVASTKGTGSASGAASGAPASAAPGPVSWDEQPIAAAASVASTTNDNEWGLTLKPRLTDSGAGLGRAVLAIAGTAGGVVTRTRHRTSPRGQVARVARPRSVIDSRAHHDRRDRRSDPREGHRLRARAPGRVRSQPRSDLAIPATQRRRWRNHDREYGDVLRDAVAVGRLPR